MSAEGALCHPRRRGLLLLEFRLVGCGVVLEAFLWGKVFFALGTVACKKKCFVGCSVSVEYVFFLNFFFHRMSGFAKICTLYK